MRRRRRVHQASRCPHHFHCSPPVCVYVRELFVVVKELNRHTISRIGPPPIRVFKLQIKKYDKESVSVRVSAA